MIKIARIFNLTFRSAFDFEHFMNLIKRFVIFQSKNFNQCFIMQNNFFIDVHQLNILNVNTYLQLIKKFHFKRRRFIINEIRVKSTFKFVSHSYVISTLIFYFFLSSWRAANRFLFQLICISFVLIMFSSAFNEDMHSHKKVFYSRKIFLSSINICDVVFRTFLALLSTFFNKHRRCIYRI